MPENLTVQRWDFAYTAIPNHFLDQIAPRLSASELRVILYIYRHTLGFHKLADCISYDQFLNGVTTSNGRRLDQGAGISRRALVTALASLEQQGIISRSSNGFAPARIKILLPEQAPLAPKQQVAPAAQTEKGPANPLHNLEASGQPLQCSRPEESNRRIAGKDITLAQEVQNLPDGAAEEVQKSNSTRITAKNQNKNNRAAELNLKILEAVRLIKDEVAGFSEPEARQLARTAFTNGRDIEYLRRLVGYVTGNDSVRSPAAVLKTLVNTNQVRTAPAAGRSSPGSASKRLEQPNPLGGRLPASWLRLLGSQTGVAAGRASNPIDFTKYSPGGKYAYLLESSALAGDQVISGRPGIR